MQVTNIVILDLCAFKFDTNNAILESEYFCIEHNVIVNFS